jgi:hypothetical protein
VVIVAAAAEIGEAEAEWNPQWVVPVRNSLLMNPWSSGFKHGYPCWDSEGSTRRRR